MLLNKMMLLPKNLWWSRKESKRKEAHPPLKERYGKGTDAEKAAAEEAAEEAAEKAAAEKAEAERTVFSATSPDTNS